MAPASICRLTLLFIHTYIINKNMKEEAKEEEDDREEKGREGEQKGQREKSNTWSTR